MSVSRWDPWRDMLTLREAMDNLLAEGMVHQGSGSQSGQGTIAAPLDVREEEGEYIITALVPGIDPANVSISILGDTLRISGERRENTERQSEGGRWLARESRYGGFSRSVTLPGGVRADEADAEFKDGVLTITLPKAMEARARNIPIRAAGGGGPEPRQIDVQTGSNDDE